MNRLLLSALAVAALAACFPSRTPDAPTPPGAVPSNLVLRSYDVPGGAAQRMRTVMRELLWFGSDGKDSNRYVGRADVGPDGRLLVLAPESVHEGVKALVASVGSKPVEEPGTIHLTYWVVSAAAGESKQGPGLSEVASALSEVEKVDGPMSFTLVEKLTVGSLSGERGTLMGRDTQVRQLATSLDGHVVADLTLERAGQRLDTRARLKPGVIAVLASAGMTGKDAEGRAIYFIVRVAADEGR